MKCENNTPVLYNYKPFPQPRKGLFQIDINVYDLSNGGWQYSTEERNIIGIADNMYVERLYTSKGSDLTSDLYGNNYMCPIGLHTSRFVEWLPTQGDLFHDNINSHKNQTT